MFTFENLRVCKKDCVSNCAFSFIAKVEGTAEWAEEDRTQTFAGSAVRLQGHADDFLIRHLEQNFGQKRLGQQHLHDRTGVQAHAEINVHADRQIPK